jgi:hypothetical protein
MAQGVEWAFEISIRFEMGATSPLAGRATVIPSLSLRRGGGGAAVDFRANR